MPSTLLDKLCGRLQILDCISQSPSLRSPDAFREAMTGNASALCRLPVSRLESDIYRIIAKVAILVDLTFQPQNFKYFALFELLLTRNILCAIYVEQNQRAFLAQMKSFIVQYDIIYHSFPINSQYLMMGGGKGLRALHFLGRVFCNVVY